MEFNGNVPLLGQNTAGIKLQTAAPIALVRDLDENCQFEPESVMQGPNGPLALIGRSNIVTAQDLIDMLVDALVPQIRIIVKQELENNLIRPE